MVHIFREPIEVRLQNLGWSRDTVMANSATCNVARERLIYDFGNRFGEISNTFIRQHWDPECVKRVKSVIVGKMNRKTCINLQDSLEQMYDTALKLKFNEVYNSSSIEFEFRTKIWLRRFALLLRIGIFFQCSATFGRVLSQGQHTLNVTGAAVQIFDPYPELTQYVFNNI